MNESIFSVYVDFFFNCFLSVLIQGGSLSVHEDNLNLLHGLTETESESAPPLIPPPDVTDTIDGKFGIEVKKELAHVFILLS